MKRLTMIFASVLLLAFMAACGNDDAKSTNTSNQNTTNSNEKTTSTKHEAEHQEPHAQEKCAFCNMKVYAKDDEMGAYTAQALTKDGKHLYFDDSGCLLNGQRQNKETYAKTWVRDVNTKEWIESDQAIIVKSDVMTPMKYGYSFFSNQTDAEQYTQEHKAQNAIITKWDNIDQVANERYQMKMQKMQQQNKNNDANGNGMHHEESNHTN